MKPIELFKEQNSAKIAVALMNECFCYYISIRLFILIWGP